MNLTSYATEYRVPVGNYQAILLLVPEYNLSFIKNSSDSQKSDSNTHNTSGKWTAKVMSNNPLVPAQFINQQGNRIPLHHVHGDNALECLYRMEALFNEPEKAFQAAKKHILLIPNSGATNINIFPEHIDNRTAAAEDMSEDGCLDVLYFVTFTSDGSVTVCDLSYSSSYKRSDYRAINDMNFCHPLSAIEYARAFAELNLYAYAPFDSKYSSSFSEI
ncbi:hypothetical protein LMH73_027170 [Vibrio splendidus]|nr:hypothetical protein [Vibrio splendidus]MCC4880488.1 hypothetical protein [Vibrio splendidus]